MATEVNCWRCNRRLHIVAPPKLEEVLITCHRCKATNVVREGQATSEKSLKNAL